MSESQDDEKNFYVDRAKRGQAACKKCKEKLPVNTLRLAKNVFSPFGNGKMKQWYHVACLFDAFKRQRPTTARIDHPDDVGNWHLLSDEDQEEILGYLPDSARIPRSVDPGKGEAANSTTQATTKKDGPSPAKGNASTSAAGQDVVDPAQQRKPSKDDYFREFRRLCAEIANASSYTAKTALVRDVFTKGADGDGFKGDLLLWCRLLLPGAVKRIYNLQSKQLIKLFSRLFGEDQDEMLEDLEQGDAAETVRVYFEKSSICVPSKKSLLTLQEVDNFLQYLSKLTREEDQLSHFRSIAGRCTSNDLKMIVRLVKHDLRINAGPKHILEAIHEDAYQAFQTSRNLETVINRIMKPETSTVATASKESVISIALMTPVLPMLAQACKTVEQAMKKCPNGMYSEIKYDGERVQLHKLGQEFKYYSRSLKPVLPHKVNHFKDFIPKAFPYGNDLILDSEILMIDTTDGKPLPFGSLGKHKKNEFKDASVCLFVFDCLFYNNESLLHKPLRERKRILKENMKEIPNHIVFSEMEEISEPKDLENMMTKVFRLGLEGLVLKDIMGIYEPGKRHWLKVKKDYLFGGAMADTADLVVLGAFYGTGNKGGMMSVFLMGCYDPGSKKWCTVTKVHTGHDDKTLEKLQTELQMVKISRDQSKVPNWLSCTKTMLPDFVAKEPKEQPVWEITGAEFTQHDVHTAAGISIRFPRVTRIRSDKDWKTATSLPELKALFKKSKENSDFTLLSRVQSPSPTPSPTSSPDKKAKKRPSSPSPKKQTTLPFSSAASSSSSGPQGTKRSRDEDKVPSDVPRRDIVRGRKKREADSGDTADLAYLEEEKFKKFKMMKKPLPDVFVGVKLIIPEEEHVANRRLLERYFLAYGGKLLKNSQKSAATHIVKTSSSAGDCGTKMDVDGEENIPEAVTVDWLWDSIKLKRIQVSGPYQVGSTAAA